MDEQTLKRHEKFRMDFLCTFSCQNDTKNVHTKFICNSCKNETKNFTYDFVALKLPPALAATAIIQLTSDHKENSKITKRQPEII